jgi:hypothetical protein
MRENHYNKEHFMYLKKLILFIILSLISCSFVFALDVETHMLLNYNISSKALNNFDLGIYLLDNLGLSGGDNEKFKNSTISELIRVGGKYEDKPPGTIPFIRSINHFHNPLKEPLSIAGFYGIGESAIAWSQKLPGSQKPGGYYSWRDVRGYYYAALTSAERTTRDDNFAKTFRGLGQLMHLIQDMSVPEHTRDDFHFFRAYEEFLAEKPEGIALTNWALENPISFDMNALLQPSDFAEAPVPIARLFDTRRYDGSNPEITTTPNIGLAEYTNANFVSGDTIFHQAFPYPKKSSTIILDCDFTHSRIPNKTFKRPYYIKIADGQTGGGSLCANGQDAPGYRLAGVDYLYLYREQVGFPPVIVIKPMDDYVFPIMHDCFSPAPSAIRRPCCTISSAARST